MSIYDTRKLPDKISLNEYPEMRLMIRSLRKEDVPSDRLNYSAEELSLKIGKSKSWLAQIENGRLNSIVKNDLISVMSYLIEIPKDNADEEIIIGMEYYKMLYDSDIQSQKELEPLTEDDLNQREMNKIIFNLKDSLNQVYKSMNTDDKHRLVESLKILENNVTNNAYPTIALLSLPIYAVNNPNTENTKKFISEINLAFTNYLTSSLNNNIL